MAAWEQRPSQCIATAEDAETSASWAGATQLGHLPTVTLAWVVVWLGLPNAGWGFAGRTEAGPWPRGPDWVGGQGGQLPTGVAAAAAVAVTNTLEVKTSINIQNYNLIFKIFNYQCCRKETIYK